MATIAVVGSGLSGLICAKTILRRCKPNQSVEITLFEKSMGPGGRMSTRRRNEDTKTGSPLNGHFDHGAQYFTVRDEVFARELDDWIKDGIASEWNGMIKVVDVATSPISIKDTSSQHETKRYVGVDGMNSIGHYLSKELNIHKSTKITKLVPKSSKWILESEKGEQFGPYDSVVISTPSQQALQLLPEIPQKSEWASKIQSVKMLPCWSYMVAFDTNKIAAPFDGAFVHNSRSISWVARNSSKPKRPNGPECWVVHGSPEWSTQHFEETPEKVKQLLRDDFKDIIGELPPIVSETVHRWAYASVANPLNEKFLWSNESKVGLIGDWLNGSRVEGAFMSGWHLGNTLSNTLLSSNPVL